MVALAQSTSAIGSSMVVAGHAGTERLGRGVLVGPTGAEGVGVSAGSNGVALGRTTAAAPKAIAATAAAATNTVLTRRTRS
jgi:hypothetical protein